MTYKETRSAYENCEKEIFFGVGEYNIPELRSVDVDLSDLKCIGFNYAMGERKRADKIVHFYLDDYQFMRVWREADKYVPIMRQFKAVLTPDFSMYTNFPKAVQIFNRYRSQWLGAYWQERGVTVIPTICWSDKSSFEWCFDGIPTRSTISVSTVGCFNSARSRAAWKLGYDECINRLEPKKILLYGTPYEETQVDTNMPVEIVYVSNANTDRFRAIDMEKKKNGKD